jgi:hypothetical protein
VTLSELAVRVQAVRERPIGRVLERPVDAVAPGRAAVAVRVGLPSGRVRAHAPLVAILLLGAVLRTWQLDAVGFNSDEAVYAGQAASLAGDPVTSQLFPVFRAHPLLFQSTLSLLYRLGGGDVAARLLVAVLGVATIGVVHLLGRVLYGRRAGLVAALLLAAMPYHVGVSRQVLLDVPMTFVLTTSLYFLVRYCRDRRLQSLLAAAAVLGGAVLTKETAVLVIPGVAAFWVLCPGIRPDVRSMLLAGAVTAAVAAVYPISLALSGRTSTGQSYVAWQLFRRTNHTVLFYAEVVPPAMGLAVVGAAALGLWLLRRSGSWREGLLVCWASAPVLYFELWPVKGYQYLLVAAPVVAVLAARALVEINVLAVGRMRRSVPRRVRAAVVGAVAVSLVVPSWLAVDPVPTTSFLAGSGGLPAGRETGHWIDANLPLGATVMTIGPSEANIVRFYGHRRAFGLSISPNPLSRNPSYEPIDNPDRELRGGAIQYVVWDAFTASRTPFFAARLQHYVDKYHGVAVHTETITIRLPDRTVVERPVMTVYEVRT